MTTENRSLAGKLLTWFLTALLVIAAIKLTFFLLGATMGLVSFLLFTVGPILLVGWLVVKLVGFFTREPEY